MSDNIIGAGIVRAAIERFNRDSTKISFAMFIMAVSMFVLAATNIWIAYR